MNEEMLKKLRGGVKSPEEVIAIAKEYGTELTLEQAQELFDMLNAGAVSGKELSDDDLEAVAGGDIIDKLCEFFGGFF